MRNPIAFAGMLALAGCGAHPGSAVTATVETVERSCDYHQTITTTMDDKVTSVKHKEVTKDCSNDPAFLKLRNQPDRRTRLFGHATAIVRYTAPQDSAEHQAWVKIDADSDAFFELERGQQIQVWVDPADPDKVSI